MIQPRISSMAYLIAEPVRAVMLITLSDGGSLSASALAEAAGVTPQTASSHLAKLLGGGLVSVESKGRNRFYRLAGADIAQVLESLAMLSPQADTWQRVPNPAAEALRLARCCYDHLAGQVGVAITQGMLERGLILDGGERGYAPTVKGIDWMRSLGLETSELCVDDFRQARRCLDWTQRQHHLAGPLATFLLAAFCNLGWMRRASGTRAVTITARGRRELKEHFAIDI